LGIQRFDYWTLQKSSLLITYSSSAAIDAKEAEQVDSGYISDDGKELERNGSSRDEEELSKYMNAQLAYGIVSSSQLDR
jgi:hypothetical protein